MPAAPWQDAASWQPSGADSSIEVRRRVVPVRMNVRGLLGNPDVTFTPAQIAVLSAALFDVAEAEDGTEFVSEPIDKNEDAGRERAARPRTDLE